MDCRALAPAPRPPRPSSGGRARGAMPPASSLKTTSGSSTSSRAAKSPAREAARNASTTRRCSRRSGSTAGVAPLTRRRARLASWRMAASERSTIGAISLNGIPNMSCRTNASRSAGVRVSSTTNNAGPTESASTASSSRPFSIVTTGSGSQLPTESSRHARLARSMPRQTRATTVVSQPPRFATAWVSARESRGHASCTASASLAEPSIRLCDRLQLLPVLLEDLGLPVAWGHLTSPRSNPSSP
jgi:hypothetical protein